MKLNSFRVVPALPERLAGLREIAYNLRWSWDDDLRTVFSRLDRELWDRTYQNPVLLLGSVSQERLEALARDDSYLALYDRALDATREVRGGRAVPLALERSLGDGVHRYAGTISCDRSGMQGYSVRVRPSHPEACDLLGTGLVTWWQG